MKEYKAVAYVVAGAMLPLKYESGWMNTEENAREELDYFLNEYLPAGMYQMSINIIERIAA